MLSELVMYGYRPCRIGGLPAGPAAWPPAVLETICGERLFAATGTTA
jgi:hypothetical protein